MEKSNWFSVGIFLLLVVIAISASKIIYTDFTVYQLKNKTLKTEADSLTSIVDDKRGEATSLNFWINQMKFSDSNNLKDMKMFLTKYDSTCSRKYLDSTRMLIKKMIKEREDWDK